MTKFVRHVCTSVEWEGKGGGGGGEEYDHA